MKNAILLFLSFVVFAQTQAQDTASIKKIKKDWSKVSLANRPKDHFLVQVGYGFWTKKPDSLKTTGTPLSVNFYFMMDFPFKSKPQYSVAVGAGLSFNMQNFNKTYIDISGSRADRLSFINVADTNHFKKYRLSTTYLEAPIELRYCNDPLNSLNSWKGAIGVKVGTLISAGTRGKTLVNKTENTLNSYVLEEKSKRYFNSTRLSVMGRVGYGIVSVYASYQINNFIKEGVGPDVRPLQVGITISGL
ncbi:MAG: outer membrane beta-barrel protein [Chitinophagaceae bacterium]